MKDSQKLMELKNGYDELKLKDSDKDAIIKYNAAKTDHLKSKNEFLVKKNYYLTNEYENRSLINRIFSRK